MTFLVRTHYPHFIKSQDHVAGKQKYLGSDPKFLIPSLILPQQLPKMVFSGQKQLQNLSSFQQIKDNVGFFSFLFEYLI